MFEDADPIEDFKKLFREEASKIRVFVDSSDLENSVKCLMNMASMVTVAAISAEATKLPEHIKAAEQAKAFTINNALPSVIKRFSSK